ncbi:MAG: SGNH/GDSL hydrolase family protein [Eubacteriales bacterium]|jgi:lysophospholipase L1-like esterase
MTKTIVFQGDSHTWGEGVGGEFLLGSPACAADMRMIPFPAPMYVNQLRRLVCEATGSSACDVDFRALNLLYTGRADIKPARGCLKIGEKPFILRGRFGFLLITFGKGAGAGTAGVYIDGEKMAEVGLEGEEPENTASGFVRLPLFCPDGDHEICVKAESGAPLLRRIETASGRYACINSGAGSRSTAEYLENYWEDYVAAMKPDIIVLECSAINDWLRKITPEEYLARVERLIAAAKALTDKVVIHDVFPIMGELRSPVSGVPYPDMIKQVRLAAEKSGTADNFVSVFDAANEAMAALNERDRAMRYFHDNWHPNEHGYKIYADTVWEKLKDKL